MIAILLAAACTSGPGGDSTLLDVVVEQNQVVPTVFHLSWSAEDLTGAHVEWGVDEGYGHTVAVDVSGPPPYETAIYGMKAGTEHHLRVVAESAEGLHESEDLVVTTGSAPAGLPVVQCEDLDPERSTDGYLVTGFVQPPTAVIIDQDCDYVWWYALDAQWGQLGRAWLNPDGASLSLGAINTVVGSEPPQQDTKVTTVRLDGTVEAERGVAFRHHDLLVLEDGTLVTPAYAPTMVDGTPLAGDTLIEVHPDGTVREVFDALAWFDPEDFLDDLEAGFAWPHANAVEYLPDRESYLVSFLAAGSIVAIDRQTGEPRWFLGGPGSDFVDERGSTEIFDRQHQLQVLDDGSLLVFENGSGTSATSRAVQLQLDFDRGVATETWRYEPGLSLMSPVLGDVHRFDSGNTLVTFSFNGEVHEVDEAGELLWKLSTGVGGALGYVTWVSELQPSAE